MFNETRYVIEQKRLALRPFYNVKDANGNLLGCVIGERMEPHYWFEDVDGTRLDDIREAEDYEVYDTQNQLRCTIKKEEQGWRDALTKGPKWQIQDPEGQLLAEVKQSGMFTADYQILALDRGIIAKIHKERSLRQLITLADTYSVNILRQSIDTVLILSFAVLLAQYLGALAST